MPGPEGTPFAPPAPGELPVVGNPIPQGETQPQQDINAANAHMTPLKLAQMRANVEATGHPSEFAGMGAALIRQGEEQQAARQAVLDAQPPAKYSATDGEGNLIPPPPEAISESPWRPNETTTTQPMITSEQVPTTTTPPSPETTTPDTTTTSPGLITGVPTTSTLPPVGELRPVPDNLKVPAEDRWVPPPSTRGMTPK